jgi:hypothetical protein
MWQGKLEAMSKTLKYYLLTVFSITISSPIFAQKEATGAEAALRNLGVEAIRQVDSDICLPATAEEYEALGKNAILMLDSCSAISTELPLRGVYAVYKNIRIQLHRVLLLDKAAEDDGSRTRQVSFYLLPIQLMKSDVKVEVDFSGQRKAFGILTFSEKAGLDKGAPAFARLDEYNDPADADPKAITEILAREYPTYFQ